MSWDHIQAPKRKGSQCITCLLWKREGRIALRVLYMCLSHIIGNLLVSNESVAFNHMTSYSTQFWLQVSYLTILTRIMPTLKMWPVFLFISEAGFSTSYYVESYFSNTFNVFSTLSRPKSVLLFLWLPPVMSPSLLSCLFSWGFLCLPFLSQLTLLSSACSFFFLSDSSFYEMPF